jgi:hypothetical protein
MAHIHFLLSSGFLPWDRDVQPVLLQPEQPQPQGDAPGRNELYSLLPT